MARKGRPVKINGVEYATIIVDGVQRFPGNMVVRRLLDEAQALGYGLNNLWREFPDARTRPWSRNEGVLSRPRILHLRLCGNLPG